MSWDARFGFFWYNDEEIFKFSQEDFDKKAKKFADAGINIVITFSCTHFRWTMRPYWDKIGRCLEQIVKACHKYNIKVVEHHSSHLTFDPLNSEDWDYMERVLNKRQSSINSWEGIRDYLAEDPIIDGEPLSSFRQIDGRTGKWARSSYHGYAMCFNNPNYRKAYFSYLEDVYKTGIDGIMTDDVQWFGDGNACACQYCRKLFKEQTGYELPQPGEAWYKFYGDYDNPIYIAWEKFRRKSTADFQYEVNKHFKSLGLNLLRPNYVSHALMSNPTGYPFDAAASIWDYVFQENCYSSIIRYSWPAFAMEAVHRYALGERNNVPSMSMFYPDREDSMYFAWALSRSWGQMFLATPEGMDLSHAEKKFRDFEKKHFCILDNLKKHADIAFYFSIKTRDYIKDSQKNNMSVLYSWMQSAYFKNHSIDIVFEYDDIKKLMEYPVIIVPNVSMMSKEEINNLRIFAEESGKLLIIGIPGLRDENGIKRDIDEILSFLGISGDISLYKLNEERIEDCVYKYNGIELNLSNIKCNYIINRGQQTNAVMTTSDGSTIGICSKVGKGEIMWLVNSFGNEKHQPEIRADRWFKHEIRVNSPEYVVDELKRIPGEIIDSLVENKLLNIIDCPEGLIATCFMDENTSRYIIHLVNTEGTLPKDSCDVGHSDIVPAFTGSSEYTIARDLIIELRKDANTKVDSVKLYTPERNYFKKIEFTYGNGKILINIPGKFFKGYAIIEIKLA
ncbi:MAG: beta-galactosidase trimerization domain-containing protein [Firmicutes bacterium]|nr:beta-galactosidase trimerization domain-containing protein [Bacillota bacterium]